MIRSDITMDWTTSPRIMYVNSPSTEITVQDAYDTAKHLEATVVGIDEPVLCDCAGTEALGGGVSVGLTLTWYNCQIAFAARSGPDWVLCKISGGNMVAKDGYNGEGNSLDPRFPTAFVTVDRASSSSATTQSITEIQHMSFNSEVWHDHDRGFTFADFPYDSELLGNSQYPASDPSEVVEIANAKKITQIRLTGAHNLSVNSDYSGFNFRGDSSVNDSIVVTSSPNIQKVTFRDLTLSGILDGDISIQYCIAYDLTYVNGHIHMCGLKGTIILDGDKKSIISNCYTVDQDNPLVINMGGSGQSLAMPNYSGIVTINNLHDADQEIGIGLNAGLVIIDSTITAGTVIISGSGMLIDNSPDTVVVDTRGLLNVDTVANSVWGYDRDA